MPDYILFACGYDEFAQYYWLGCLFRFSMPPHMVQYFNMEQVAFYETEHWR